MATQDIDLSRAAWRKSARSNNGGACVEVATNIPGIIAVRDSKHPDGGALTLTPETWQSLLAEIKAGRLS